MGHSLRVGEWKPAETAGTHSQGALAPLQWIADQMGCDVVVRDVSTARIRALEAELNRLKGAA